MDVSGISSSKKAYLKGFYLEQNNPNPFNGKTCIHFGLPYKAKVSIIVTDSFGRVVDKMIANFYEAGNYKLDFLADGLPKGSYFYHVIADIFSESREMELTK